MRFGDYVNQSSPEAFSRFNVVMSERNRRNAVDSVPSDQFATLEATPMNAYRDAPSAQGRFPVVLYFGGLDAEINSNIILAEYLASRGYIFASISLLGPTDEQTFQSRTPDDLESSVRDMEFAWSVLAESPNLDKAKLAVMGHSVGAIEAALFGLRNSNVSAVIALDGTYAFQGLSTVLTQSYGYAPEKMRAAYLDLRRAQGAQGDEPLDLTAVDSFRHSDRKFITIKKMHHSDFTAFAMIGQRFHTPITAKYPLSGWNRETAKSGYQQVCRIVVAFLDVEIRGDLTAMTALANAVGGAEGGVLNHQQGTPVPPSPLEAAALASQQGLVGVQTLISKICGVEGVEACIDADRFNTWGYNLLGQNRGKDALAVFELAAWAHPTSANAQDSLADSYLAVGDKEGAKRALTDSRII
jgi:dienelactone hydrolase